MIDGSCTNELFGTPKIQGPLESGDATDDRGYALDTLIMYYPKEDPEPEDSAPDEDGNVCTAAE